MKTSDEERNGLRGGIVSAQTEVQAGPLDAPEQKTKQKKAASQTAARAQRSASKPSIAKPDRRLVEAAAIGPDAVAAAIAAGAGKNAAKELDAEGLTPFLMAAKARDLRSMSLLLPLSDPTARASDSLRRDAMSIALPETEGMSPGELAAKDAETASLLERMAPYCGGAARSETGETALMAAARRGLAQCVAILGPLSPLMAKNEEGDTALTIAAAANQPECMEWLLDAHAQWMRGSDAQTEKDHKGRDPLIVATQHGAVDCVRRLLARGWPLSERDVVGRDALAFALMGKDEEKAAICVRELLAAWAKWEGPGQQRTRMALWSVLSESRVCAKTMRELVKWVDLNDRRFAEKESALDWAAQNGAGREVIEILLESGADPHSANATGMTALMLMAWWGRDIHPIRGDPLAGEGRERRLESWLDSARALARVCDAEHVKKALEMAKNGARNGTECCEALAEVLDRDLAQKEADALSQAMSEGQGAASIEATLRVREPQAGQAGEEGNISRRKPRAL